MCEFRVAAILCVAAVGALGGTSAGDEIDEVVNELRESGAEVSLVETFESGREVNVTFDLKHLTDQDMRNVCRISRIRSLTLNLCKIPHGSWRHLDRHSHLRDLVVFRSDFQVSELPRLPKLETLETDEDFFRKGIDGIRERVPRLRRVVIHGEAEDASPSIVELISNSNLTLTELLLVQVKLAKSDLARIGKLTQLRELSLDDCHFPSHELRELGGLRLLHSLKLAGSEALYSTEVGDEDVQPLSRLPFLKSLCLISDRVNGSCIEKFSSLEEVEIRGDNCDDSTVDSISRIQGIRSVSMSCRRITPSGLRKLSACRLESVLLANATVLAGEGRLLFANPRLRELFLWSESRVEMPPLTEESLAELPELRNLDVSSTILANSHLRGLRSTRLESLRCHLERLDAEAVQCLLALPYLQRLQVRVLSPETSKSSIADLELSIPNVTITFPD